MSKYTGIISITQKFEGFVRVAELKEEGAVFIANADLNTALQGDTVEIEVTGKNEYGPLGKVLSIQKRGKRSHAGTIRKEQGIFVVAPDDKKTYVEFLVKPEDSMDVDAGKKVAVEMTTWENPKELPYAKVIKILGNPGENDAEMIAYAMERGFSDEHKAAVTEEAHQISDKGITEEDKKNRRDFRDVLTFTIDPFDAKDFDDAISFKKLDDENGLEVYEVGVHIADVSYYVRPDMALDAEAVERQTSVYLVDRCIPMLPEELSNDLCSLVEGKDRLVMSAVFKINSKAEVLDAWYGRAVINSAKRFTYEEAQESLDNPTSGLYFTELDTLNRLAKIMCAARFENGALSLDSEEVKFKFDEKGVPIDVYIKVRGDTHKMIEEWMLLANRKVSEFITKSQDTKTPLCVYRIHDKPDADKMRELQLFIKGMGHNVRYIDGVIPSQDINKLLKELDGQPSKDLLQTNVARSMQKAIYSTKNVGHYGLAFEYYSHFTSPIRRYPDVLTHRILMRVLEHDEIKDGETVALEKICSHASFREKEAADAERGSIKYKQVEYMSYRVGEIFDGVVSGVSRGGVFVEEVKSHCEGMVRMRDLGTDFYSYDEKNQRMVGEKSGEDWRIGDRVKIKVKSANLEDRVIDYEIAR